MDRLIPIVLVLLCGCNPPAVPDCRDKVTLLNRTGQPQITCDYRAEVSHERMPDEQILVICRCPKLKAEAEPE